ncbi:MAG: hypothetical protein OEN56_09875 [Gemmatimonadota bacterium]|nr:hypothetical protein [Gemmatimonadota bacterium]
MSRAPKVWAGLATLLTAACTIAPAPEGGLSTADADALPPPGYGTLRQEEISMTLRSQDLEIMVTPLAESIIVVTAPDTYDRLSGIAESHRASAPPDGTLFLVSFYTQQPEVRFVPEEVQILSRGLRLRPLSVSPITPTWGQRRVQQRRTEMAVYAFSSEADLESDLALAYGLEQAGTWPAILARVQAERARARARAGIGTERRR